MRICLLGYPEVAKGNFCNGVSKVIYEMTEYFCKRGDTVFHYHLFRREQYEELNGFLLSNRIDVAIWHMTTLKIKGRLHLPCPLICLWHNDPNAISCNYAVEFCDKYRVSSFGEKLLTSKIISGILSKMRACYYQVMYTYVVSCANRYVLLSDGFKKKFLPAKLFPKRVVSIPNGLSLDTEFQYDESNKNNTVLYVGRLRYEKRVNYLLKAWSIVEKSNDNWELRIVGDEPNAEEYKSLANELDLKRCKFEGWQKDPTPWMKKSKILALTSEIEGFPLVLSEAAQYGNIPVVMNSFAAAEDFIANNVNGLLIRPRDYDAFAKGLLDLINNPRKLCSLSKSAMDNAKRYGLDVVMEKWVNLINEVVGNNEK